MPSIVIDIDDAIVDTWSPYEQQCFMEAIREMASSEFFFSIKGIYFYHEGYNDGTDN